MGWIVRLPRQRDDILLRDGAFRQDMAGGPGLALAGSEPRQWVIAIILVATAIRMVLAGLTGFGFDEAYMAGNARDFSLSYFDHPPLHVWLAGGARWLTGSENNLVLRLPFILLFAGSTWLMYRLASLLFGEAAGVWAAFILNIAPVFTLATASWILPDGPLYFFQLLAAWLLARLFFTEMPAERRPWFWVGLGLAIGFGLLSKYHMLLFGAGVFLFLVTTRAGRASLSTVWPWVAAVIAGSFFLPVILWHAGHDFVGLSFHTQRLGDASSFKIKYFLELLAGQAGYLLPWIFLPLAALLVQALWRGPREPSRWMLAMLALGPILAFNAASLSARGLPHWPMPGWLMLVPLLGAVLAGATGRAAWHLRRAAIGHAIVIPLLLLALASQVSNAWMTRAISQIADVQDPTLELLDWRDVRQALEERGEWREDMLVASASWQYAGKLSHALGDEAVVLCLCDNPKHFPYLPGTTGHAGAEVIVLFPEHRIRRYLGPLQEYFETVEAMEPISLTKAGRPAQQLAVFRGIGLVDNYHSGR
jgi:hypothetical protein